MIGQILNNHYIITTRLGKGAMGTVYRATDKQNGREVALKVISSELVVDPDMLERFKREGEALSKLKHPNIVEFLDAFQHDEHYVIVMEYVSGGSLHELISKGPLPIERANHIALELCDALIRSHHLNIIHRDLKPENILIDEDGTPKLADFGVARLSEGTRMTRSGTQVGTPYYMSPEAWEGKTLDAQADIWSLGVILFEMLTGQVPFGGDTGAAVMNKVLTTQPPDLKKLRAEVPPNFAQIIKQMLTRDRKKRYQTMRQLAADLERGQLSQSNLKTIPGSSKLIQTGILAVAVISLAAVIFNSRISTLLTSPNPTLPATQKPRAETAAPELTQPAQITSTATQSVILPATAIVKEPERIFYDQFDESAHDGDFDRSLWIARSSKCTITQLGGILQFVNDPIGSHQECDLYAGKPTTLQSASQLGVFEVQAMISSDYNRKAVISKEIQFRTDAYPGGPWFAICGLIANGESDVTGFMSISNPSNGGQQEYYGSTAVENGFDAWHTVHLEMEPKSLAVSCLVDGQLVGAVIPKDTEFLATVQFQRVIEAARGPEAFATSYVDNVYSRSFPVLSWEFNRDGDLEAWGVEDWQSAGLRDLKVSNGSFSATATRPDPELYSIEQMNIDASNSSQIEIRMRLSAGKEGVIYFNQAPGEWGENQGKNFSVFADNEFHTYLLDMDNLSSWKGIINQLRLDLLDATGATIEIDYIRLYP